MPPILLDTSQFLVYRDKTFFEDPFVVKGPKWRGQDGRRCPGRSRRRYEIFGGPRLPLLAGGQGRVVHRLVGQQYLQSPADEPEREGHSVIAGAVNTFFKGSRERAMAALLGADNKPLDILEIAKRAAAYVHSCHVEITGHYAIA